MDDLDSRSSTLKTALSLREVARAEAAPSEELRTLSPTLVQAMWESGLMTAMNPFEAGGSEPDFRDMIETWVEMAWQDGSFGWVGIANFPSSVAAAAYLPDEGFDEVFTANDNRAALGGQFAPNGQGQVVDGGYRLSGAWNFGSGTGHSAYVAAGFLPMEDGAVRMVSETRPDLYVAILPREDVTFTDGWHVQGLKGTGSYDYNCQDVFVPEHRTFPLFTYDAHRGTAPTFRMGLMAITGAGHASWALGVAKSMLDDVQDIARTRLRMGDLSPIASRSTFQAGLTRHLSMWRAARLLVLDAYTTAEAAVAAGEPLTPTLRADMRASSVHATDVARSCAEWAHLAAGTTAIREGSRFERAFRDIYTGTQHAFISERVATEAAQVWLGLVPDHPSL